MTKLTIGESLLTASDGLIFGCNANVNVPLHLDISTQRLYWEGSVKDWVILLRKTSQYRPHQAVADTLAAQVAPSQAERLLRLIQAIADGRVIERDKVWRIWEPIEVDDDGSDPF